MKKLFLLGVIFFSLLFEKDWGWALFAQNSNLVFFAQGGEPFYVFLNGIKQNQHPAINVKIIGLEENKFNLLIVLPHPDFSMINKAVKITPNKESVYAIVKSKSGNFDLIAKGENQLSFQPSAPNQQIIKLVSHLENAPAMPLGVGAGMNMMTGNVEQTSVTYNTNVNTTIVNVNQNPNYLPNYNGPIGCPKPMTPEEFQSAKNTINSKDFESSKISIAKQIAGSNCLFSSQVKEIMQLFGFEGTKIEFAKFAYTHTYDKGNYFMVNDAFEFDSSISELNKFINK